MSEESIVRTAGQSRVQRVRHELKRRELQVLRVEDISPHYRSITLGGDSLADFVSASFDDHLKIMLDDEVRRDYTPRRFDPAARELTIEFALHGEGPAAEWAAQAEAGQRLTIGGPRGSFIVPLDYAWHLFVGDETALPAVARRLEELPAGARAIAILKTDDVADQRRFQTAAGLALQWVASDAELLDAIRALKLPAGEGYAWCAGEAATMAAMRRLLVDEKGHDRHAIRAAAYWKRGEVAHHQNIEE